MVCAEIKWAAPAVLLLVALVRINALSLGYAVFFVTFFLSLPVFEARPDAEHWEQVQRHWKVRKLYWVALVLYSTLVCIGHVFFQLMFAGGLLGNSDNESSLLRDLGYFPLRSASEGAAAVLPDALMLVFSSVCLVLLTRYAQREPVSAPPRSALPLKFAACLALFVVAICSPSLFGLAYIVAFTVYIVLWCLRPQEFNDNQQLPRISPIVLLCMSVHLLAAYAYTMEPVRELVGSQAAGLFGLVSPSDSRAGPVYVSLSVEVVLFVLLCHFGSVQAAMQYHRHLRSDVSLVGGSALSAGDLALASEASKGRQSSLPLDVRLRLLLETLIRRYGRWACHGTLFFTAFATPSWLSLGLLGLSALGVAMPTGLFSALAPPSLLFAALAGLLQFLFTIPYLMPSSPTLDTVGLSEHQPYPLFFLTVAYLPVLAHAGYCRVIRVQQDEEQTGASLSEYSLYNAACSGDVHTLRRAIAVGAPALQSSHGGLTLIHLASRHGHAECAALLSRAINVNALDARNNTALHIAYANGHDDVVAALLYVGADPRAINDRGLRYNEASLGVLAWLLRAVRFAFNLLWSLTYSLFDTAALILIFLDGTQRADMVHMGYVLFALLLFAFPPLAQSLWFSLCAYCSVVLLMLFAWCVLLSDGSVDQQRISWSDDVGLVDTDNLWQDLAFAYVSLIAAAAAWHLVRLRARKDANVTRGALLVWFDLRAPAPTDREQLPPEERALRQPPLLVRLVRGVWEFIMHILAEYGQLLSCTALFLVASYGSEASLLQFGFLLLFVAAMVLYMFGPSPLVPLSRLRALQLYWFIAACYAAVVFLCLVAFQFPVVYASITSSWSNPAQLALVGLVHADPTTSWSMLRQLVPATVVLVVASMQYRQLLVTTLDQRPGAYQSLRRHSNSQGDEEDLAALPHADRQNSIALARIDGSDMEVQEAGERELPAEPAPSHNLLIRVLEATMSLVRASCVIHCVKISVIVTWLVISLVNPPSIACLAYLLLLVVFLPFGGRSLWLPLGLYSSVLLAAKFIFQLNTVHSFFSKITNTTWWGFQEMPSGGLSALLWGDSLILVAAVLHRMAQRDWVMEFPESPSQPAGSSSSAVVPLASSNTEDRGKDHDAPSAVGAGPDRDAESETWWSETKHFLLNIWVRIRWLALSGILGLQIALVMLLLASFARCNLLSLVLVALVLGAYILGGRAVLARYWEWLVGLCLLSLLSQYFLAAGPPPDADGSFDWIRGWNFRIQRFFMLGGYSAAELNWDFFALLMVALQAPLFRRERRAARIAQHRRELGIAGSDGDLDLAAEDEDVVAMEVVAPPEPVGDPTAWYSTIWPELRELSVRLSDKIVLLLVFVLGTLDAELLSLGYVVLALIVAFHRDLYVGGERGSSGFHAYMSDWRRLHSFNWLVMLLLALYQLPFITTSLFDSPYIKWEEVLGLHQFDVDSSAPTGKGIPGRAFSREGALRCIIIFLLVDLQLLVFRTSDYHLVLQEFEVERANAEARGVESALARKRERMSRLQRILRWRRNMQRKFDQLSDWLFSFVREQHNAHGKSGEPFLDEEVWPNPWNESKGQLRDDGWAEASKDEAKEEKGVERHHEQGLFSGRKGRRSRGQLSLGDSESTASSNLLERAIAQRQDMEDELAEASTSSDDQEEEDLEASQDPSQSWFRTQITSFREWFRGRLIRGIDNTLWVVVERDELTGVSVKASAPLSTLSTWSLLKRWLVSNTEFVCFFVYLVGAAANPSLLSLLIPMLVFLYASMQSPRAGRGFWSLAVLYSALCVCIKFAFQLPIFCVTDLDNSYTLAPSPLCANSAFSYTDEDELAPDYVLGLHKTTPGAFFAYILWDVLAILCVLWHRAIMERKGVWRYDEELLGDPLLAHQQPHRFTDADSASVSTVENVDHKRTENAGKSTMVPRPSRHESLNEAIAKHVDPTEQALEKSAQKLWKAAVPRFVRDYFFSVVPRDRRHIHLVKPGRDLYLASFVLELLSAIFILLFFSVMATPTQSSVIDSWSAGVFSGTMVLMLVIQILLIVLDRIAYLRRSLRWKLLVHFVSALLWIPLMFFVWPQSSRSTISGNGALFFFFVFKSAYLLVGGAQIREGYPTVERTGFQYLLRRPSTLRIFLMAICMDCVAARSYVFRIYRALPFVFELRAILDWLSHDSSMNLWESFKLEDIYANMYLVQCDLLSRRDHTRGEAQPRWTKLIHGVLVFVGLLLIIVAILFIFSSANPVASYNPVQQVQLSVSVRAHDGSYHLLTISSMERLSVAGRETYVRLKRDRVIGEEPERNVQEAHMAFFADSMWDISGPSQQALVATLLAPQANNNTQSGAVALVIRLDFTRAFPSSQRVGTLENVVPLSRGAQDQLAAIVGAEHTTGNDSTEESGAGVVLVNAVPRHVHLPSPGSPTLLSQKFSPAFLELQSQDNGKFWNLKVDSSSNHGVTVVTVSDPFIENMWNQNMGFHLSVIGLYFVVLLTVGRFVRLAFASEMIMIPYEDLHNVRWLMLMCESIYVARYHHQLYTEERLYRRLIKIFRTPTLLISLSRRQAVSINKDE